MIGKYRPDCSNYCSINERCQPDIIDPPDKFEFNEYQHLEDFIETIDDPHIAGQLFRSIRGRDAFGRLKDALCRFGLENRWYRYLDQATKEFAIEWAKDNDVPCEDDLSKMKRDR